MTHLRFFLLVLTILVVSNTSGAASAQAEPTPPAPIQPFVPNLQVSLSDLGYDDVSVRGSFGTALIYLPIPLAWQAHDAAVSLHILRSPLLRDISSLTVYANNEPLTSVALAGGKELTVDFVIPARLLKSPGVQLQFEGYLRVTNDTCEVSNIPSQWVRVLGDSQFTWNFQRSPDLPQLEDLPALMFSTGLFTGQEPVLFVLPDAPTNTTLVAAMQTAAGLAQLLSSATYPINVETVSSASPAQLEANNVVLVGLPQENTLIGQLAPASQLLGKDNRFTTLDGQAIADDDGLIQVLVSPWNEARHVLLVSANSEAGLETLGRALVERTTLNQLTGNFQFVSRPLDVGQDTQPRPWTTAQTSFEQLGSGSRTEQGVGLINEYYSFYLAPGSTFGSGAQLVLNGSASPTLANNESYVAAFINEIPLGAYHTTDLIDQGKLTFPIPPDLIGRPLAQPINLRLEVANLVEQQQCTAANPGNAWTRINGSSYFAANDTKESLPSLRAFPYPFASQAPVRFVLPETIENTTISAAVRLAFTLGFYASSTPDIEVIHEAELSSTPANDNLILLANGTAPSALTTLLAPLTDGKTAANPNQALLDTSVYQSIPEPFGLLYTMLSPKNAERAVLVIASAGDEGFEAAATLLTGQIPPVAVTGTTAIVQKGHSAYVVDHPADIQTLVALTSPTETTVAPAAPTGNTPATPQSMSTADLSVLIIVVPIMVSLLIILIIWVLRSSRGSKT